MRSRLNWNSEFGSGGFSGEGKAGVPGEKPLRARERTNNKVNPNRLYMYVATRWETSAFPMVHHPCSLQRVEQWKTLRGHYQWFHKHWIRREVKKKVEIKLFLLGKIFFYFYQLCGVWATMTFTGNTIKTKTV